MQEPVDPALSTDKIKAVLCENLGLDVLGFRWDLKSTDIPKWDSLQVLGMVVDLERECNINVTDADVAALNGIGSVVEMLKSKGVGIDTAINDAPAVHPYVIGEHTVCHIGKGGICPGAKIGDYCKIQNFTVICEGVTIEDGVFIGSHVAFTNDRRPRAINPDGSMKGSKDWRCENTLIKYGAAIASGCVICPGVTIGRWAMVCAGSVVVHDVPAYAKVFGNPARQVGWVDECGNDITKDERDRKANETC